MQTQISFTADKQLKDRVMEKAKSEGISLKTLMVYAMKGFVDGKISLGIKVSDEESVVEKLTFTDKELNRRAKKLTGLLS